MLSTVWRRLTTLGTNCNTSCWQGDAGKLCCGAWRARLHWPADNELLATGAQERLQFAGCCSMLTADACGSCGTSRTTRESLSLRQGDAGIAVQSEGLAEYVSTRVTVAAEVESIHISSASG